MTATNLRMDYCSVEDIPRLRQYLLQYWASDHVLASDGDLLDWQHFDEDHDQYNYVLAWSDGEDLPIGVLGFIPTARYDRALAGHNTMWLALWSVREDVRVGGLGIRLLNFALQSQAYEAFGTIGISHATETLLRAYGCKAGAMNHHYMPAAHRETFVIMKPSGRLSEPAVTTGVSMVAMSRDEVTSLEGRLTIGDRADTTPVKSATYFANRYFDHPSYVYSVWALQHGDAFIGLVAARVVEANGSSALRIVDYLGPTNGLLGSYDAIQAMLRTLDAEYADLLNFGLPIEFMKQAGFELKEPEGDAVVPDYFEPFEQRNVVKRFVFKPPSGGNFMLFKADADQDRPNLPRIREGEATCDEA